MNGITHKQAQKYLRFDLDGLLTDEQRRDLEAHLSGCEACRAEAQAFSTLTSRLQSGFRSRWDAQDGPSKNVMATVRSQTRRIIMSNRINVTFKALGGIAAILVFGFLTNMLVSQMRDHSVAANTTQVSNNISPVSTMQTDGQWIAFQMEKDGNMDIYAIRSDGSMLTNLTNTPSVDKSPVWSPDGARIAFVSDRDGNENIYVMNLDGSGLTLLTDGPASDAPPLWSPDGKKIAYQSRDINANVANIFVVDANGQNRRQLTKDLQGVVIPEAWSLDGQFLFFLKDQQIVKVNTDTGDVSPVTPAGDISGHFALSADSAEIHYLVECVQSSAEFCVRVKTILTDSMEEKADSSMEIQQVCSTLDVNSGYYYMSKWSPDRTKILFAFVCKENNALFYIANADGSDFKPLINYPIPGSGAGFDWSADSHSIAFRSSFDGKGESLYILNVDEAIQNPEHRPILLNADVQNPFFPAWQPVLIDKLIEEQKPVEEPTEKRLIAFASAVESDNLDIYTMYSDGSGLTNLTNDPAQDINPYWSPDGKHIAFMSDRNGFTDIYVMNADGSGLTRVTNNDQPTVNGHHEFGVSDHGPWSPDGSKLLFTEWTPDTEKWKLYTVDTAGQNKTPIADVPNIYTNPSWSPDGKHIAYVSMDAAKTHLYVVGADGSTLTDVSQMVPKEKQLFTTNYTWSAEGNIRFVAIQVSENSASPDYTLYEATIDGATLAEITHTSTGPADIWNGTIFVAGTSTLNWLRPDGSYREYKPFEKCQIGSDPQYANLYKRSSHGYLFFAAGCPNGDWWFTWANPQGTQVQQLLDYPFPDRQGFSNIAWSSDDRYIALNAVSSNITYLYVIDVAKTLKDPSTQSVKIALMGGEQYSNISWQPGP